MTDEFKDSDSNGESENYEQPRDFFLSDNRYSVVAKKLKKDYYVKGRSEPVMALRGVHMEIPKGSMVAIKGPSGSGKTTLLQMIGALDKPTDGDIAVKGINLGKMSGKELTDFRAKTIGFVFQTFNLIPSLTALENVELPMENLNIPPVERRQRAITLLESVGMRNRMDYRPLKLSGGEQQRVAIARALANDPEIILADEPTGSLDTKTGTKIVRLLNKLRQDKDKTVIIVTHSGSVARACDICFEIRDGVIFNEVDMQEATHKESELQTLHLALAISSKQARKLINAGYSTPEAVSECSDDELAKLLGSVKLAARVSRRAEEYMTAGQDD